MTFKPRPVYTAEATAKHIEGTVSVKIHVAANGAVRVIAVTSGLGYGLDQAAMQAVQGNALQAGRRCAGQSHRLGRCGEHQLPAGFLMPGTRRKAVTGRAVEQAVSRSGLAKVCRRLVLRLA